MDKVGLYLCGCGPNIADAVDLDRIAEQIKKDGKVAGVERHKLLCSEDGKRFLAETIKAQGYDRVVVAACSPKQHQVTFEQVVASVGLNPQMMQMVNIREQCAWTTPDVGQATTKALRFVRAAVSRVRYHEALEQKEIDCSPDLLVIGGGVAGIEVALRTAARGRQVYLVEQNELGGMVPTRNTLFPTMAPAGDYLEARVAAVRNNKQIRLYERSRVLEVLGFFGNFVASLQTGDGKRIEVKAGAVVLAIGAQAFVPEGIYGYGKVDGVYTTGEFERADLEGLRSVAIVHCAGREKLGYCSGVCCAEAMRAARAVKKVSSGTEVIEFYRELCLPGKEYDRFYQGTVEQGIRFIRFQSIEVTGGEKGPVIRYQTEDGNEEQLAVDAVVLSTGLAAEPANAGLAEMFNLALDEHGFFKEEHTVLNPVATMAEGVFIAGCCRGPAGIRAATTDAAAVAGKVLSALVPGRRLQLEIRTSEVSQTLCVGCGTCVTVCAYGAVMLDEARGIAVVNEVLCRGCGNCASACPSGAARHRHFTTRQLGQEMTEILK